MKRTSSVPVDAGVRAFDDSTSPPCIVVDDERNCSAKPVSKNATTIQDVTPTVISKQNSPPHQPLSFHGDKPSADSPTSIPPRSRRSKSSWPAYLTRGTFLGIAALVLLIAMAVYFSSFSWGLVIGVASTLSTIYTYSWINSHFNPRCPFSNQPLQEGNDVDGLCCSWHQQSKSASSDHPPYWPVYAPAIADPPQMRDLVAPSVPHTAEDESWGTQLPPGGLLASGLGFKLNETDLPVYRGWMNEIVNYNAATHHISKSHSVYVTLDGCQLRLQRPKQNISRRSVWNEESPSVARTRFTHQRIIDLSGTSIQLLPEGLVSKRKWSKKYPIVVLIPSKTGYPKSSSVSSSKLLCTEKLSSSRDGSPSSHYRLTPAGSQSNHLHPSMSDPDFRSAFADNAVAQSLGVPGHGAKRPSGAVVDDDAFHNAPPNDQDDDGYRNEGEEEDEFTVIHPDEAAFETIYLFGRTSREKETWFRRLRSACRGKPFYWTPQSAIKTYMTRGLYESSHSDTTSASAGADPSTTTKHTASGDQQELAATSGPPPPASEPSSSSDNYVAYVRYMAKFMPAKWLLLAPQVFGLNVNHIQCEPSCVWLNAALGRVFWNFLREPVWLDKVKEKIQAKLKKIHLPPFISDLTVVGIEIGQELPTIRYVGRPFLDPQGLWCELGVSYAGGFSVALETNVTLSKWNQKSRMVAMLNDDVGVTFSTPIGGQDSPTAQQQVAAKLGAYQSDEEDSVDSSTDSDTPMETSSSVLTDPLPPAPSLNRSNSHEKQLPEPDTNVDSNQVSVLPAHKDLHPLAMPSKRRIYRFVDKIARSSYFQKAVDIKFVQRGMEMLSNTPIVLEVEVQALSGTLLVNIPPPPSDRLWYGFRPTPQLRLKAKPKFGEKVISMGKLLEWIEKKCVLEFQRVLVLPNMEDWTIPLLVSKNP